jgi:hypothetical protein
MTSFVNVDLVPPWRRVLGVTLEDGTCPALEFLGSLQLQPRQPFKALAIRLCAHGTLMNEDHFRRLVLSGGPPVYEFKVHVGPGWRLYVVQGGPCWYVTHGRRKPSDRKVRAEADKAREYFARRRAT